MTMSAVKAKSVRFQLLDYLKEVINNLLSSLLLPIAPDAYRFVELYSASDTKIVREFCLSLQADVPRIISRIHSLTGFQLEQFAQLLELKYKKALGSADFESDEARDEFYLDLTFHIIRDLDNYIQEWDKPKESLENTIDLKRGGSAASFFLYPNS